MSTELEILDIKGNTLVLDPRSKILTTYLFILGLAVSVDYFQIFLYLLLFIPLTLLYRPHMVFLKRIFFTLPMLLIICFVMYFALQTDIVPIRIFGYTRPYTKVGFIILIAYRFSVIVLYNYMLLHSEPSHTIIIEALAGFRLGGFFVTILLLIKKLSTRISDDYSKMEEAAKIKGAFSRNIVITNFIRLLILARIFSRTIKYSQSISKTLSARGFHDHFSPSTRPWTSEGLTMFMFAVVFFILISIIPWVRLL